MSANVISLYFVMLRPTDSAAIELSRIAFTALPVLVIRDDERYKKQDEAYNE